MSLLQSIIREYKTKGLYGVKRLIQKRYFEQAKPIRNFKLYSQYFKGKSGIEIGGLSPIFNTEVPLYKIIENVDGCNFSSQTVWEGTIQEGNSYNFFESKKGHQYVCEASDLKDVPSDKYDFLISSHCLEHCANALKTVEEWLRVVKKGGAILLVLPNKNFTFDHNRYVTTFDHLLDDYNKKIDETDLTHLPEILLLHDLSMDVDAGTKEQFEKRSQDNFYNRCLHQHVFDFKLLEQIFEYNNIQVIDKSFAKPYHQIILGVKK
jgi:predicted SAM-dependent methyltransferase